MVAKPGSTPAWTGLREDLRRYIRRRVPRSDIADDLLQETFLRIHRGIGSLSDSDRLIPWVYAIARNVVHDYHRRKRDATIPLNEAGIAAAPPLDDSRASSRAASWLDGMMARLPDKSRMAVQLSEIEGLSQKEVAERLGLSLTAAKSRVRRGRAQLRSMIEACCTFEFDRRGNIIDYSRKATPAAGTSGCAPCDEDGCVP